MSDFYADGIHFRRSLLAVSISALLPLTAASAAEPVDQLGALEVWGTEISASSVNLKSDTLAIKQADHVSDLLRSIPGVDVGGAHSLNQRITIRSMDDKDLRITIDGANQNTYMYHHMGNLQIHADILEKVDVEVGNTSVINGGLGGAVRFETKSAKQLLEKDQKVGARVQATYGDNSGSSYAVTGYGQLSESFDILAYYNDVQRDNYEVGGGKIKDYSGNTVEGTDGKVRGLEGDLSDMLLKFGWDLTDNQRIELGYESYKDEGDYSYRPDMGLATDLAITNNLEVPLLWPTEYTRDTLTLNYDVTWGEASYLKASLFNNVSKLERDESGYAENPAFAAWAAQVEGEATNSGLNVLGETEMSQLLLTYGLEHIKYDTDYKNSPIDGEVVKASEEAVDTALFLQARYQFDNGLAVTPGIRHNEYDIDSTVVDDKFSETTGALAAEYQFGYNVLLKASATQIFKGPEIGEVFTGAGSDDTPNPGIDAETGVNKELTLAFEDSVFGAERFTAGVTAFQTDVDDYIYDYATPPAGVDARSWKDNVGDMSIDGIEAYVGYDKGPLSALLTYSTADSELDAFAQYAALNGARLDRTQGDTYTAEVNYDLDALNLTLHWDVLWVDDVKAGLDLDGASQDNAKDGFTVHNISARWEPAQLPNASLTFGVDNLFDEFYASQSSRTGLSFHPRFGELYLQDYEPGRNIKVTAAYKF